MKTDSFYRLYRQIYIEIDSWRTTLVPLFQEFLFQNLADKFKKINYWKNIKSGGKSGITICYNFWQCKNKKETNKVRKKKMCDGRVGRQNRHKHRHVSNEISGLLWIMFLIMTLQWPRWVENVGRITISSVIQSFHRTANSTMCTLR